MYTRIPETPATNLQQRGFVLIVALILLLVLTILGLAAARSTSLEERMAGNARNHDIAFQAAEAALGAGINCIRTGAAACSTFSTASTGGNGAYIFNPLVGGGAIWNQSGFWTTSGNTIYYNSYAGGSLPNVAQQPQFIVEQMPPVAAPGGSLGQSQYGAGAPSISRWRITSYGVGGDTSSTVILQSIYSCCQQAGG